MRVRGAKASGGSAAWLWLAAVLAAGPAAAFDEFLLDQLQQRMVRCAGQSSHEFSCTSGLCYDALHLRTETVSAGCASPNACVKAGCAMDEANDTFVCCCAHSFCNGKSAHMVQARWRMFTRGHYKPPHSDGAAGGGERRSLAPRDTAGRSASAAVAQEPHPSPASTVGGPITSTPTSTDAATTPSTVQQTTTTATTTTTTAATTARTMGTSEPTIKDTVNATETTSTTVKVTKKKIAAKVTKMPAARANSTRPGGRRAPTTARRPPYVVAKSLNVTTRPRFTTTKLPTAPTTTMKATSITSTVSTTAKAETTTGKTTTTSTMTTRKPTTTRVAFIADISDAPTTAEAGGELPEYRPRHPPVLKSRGQSSASRTIAPPTTTSTLGTTATEKSEKMVRVKTQEQVPRIPAVPQQPAAASERSGSASSASQSPQDLGAAIPGGSTVFLESPVLEGKRRADRTTRSPATDGARQRHAAHAYRTFPWYFVVVLGFAVASALFALVYALLRRFYPRVRNFAWRASPRDSLQYIKEEEHGDGSTSASAEDSDSGAGAVYRSGAGAGRALTPAERASAAHLLDSGREKRASASSSRKTSIWNFFRVPRRGSAGGSPKGSAVRVPNGTTSDSLASHCTAVTTLSSEGSPPVAAAPDDRELTVIDPLLNKQYTGTIHISAPPPLPQANGKR